VSVNDRLMVEHTSTMMKVNLKLSIVITVVLIHLTSFDTAHDCNRFVGTVSSHAQKCPVSRNIHRESEKFAEIFCGLNGPYFMTN